jgi:hypothetical protein
MNRVIREVVSEEQEINLIEAILIKYFQPRFNQVFKRKFPSPAHKTYSQCYDLDFNTVSVEIDTGDLGLGFIPKL